MNHKDNRPNMKKSYGNDKRKQSKTEIIKKKNDKDTEIKDIRESLPDPAEIKDLLGVFSPFNINKITPIGAFLSPISHPDFEILLPKNELEGKELRRSELISAFTYLDSEDRPVATLREPSLTLGGLALLRCNQVTPVGAFLEWGLMKDLFLPFKEQTARIKEGDQALVTLYMDKSSRLCASMKVYKLLRKDSPYKANDHVTGFIYELSDEHGAYVAVDNIFSAKIPARELVERVRIGEQRDLRVSKVLADGKLELSMREQKYLQLDNDCIRIYEELKASTKGFLPYHDKTESLIIKNKFNMTKNAFKRAIGHLYKKGMITISENGISLTGKTDA